MQKLILAFLLPFLFVSSLSAQEVNKSLTLGIDPLVIAVLNGFEVEAGLNLGKNRFAIEYLGAELPAAWNSQIDEFEKVSADILEISYGRFLNSEQKGFHYGLAYSLFSNYTVENEVGESLEKDNSKLGIRLGYMWVPFKNAGFFIEPLFNFGFYLNDEDLDFGGGEVFEERSFAGSGPVIHFGWKIPLN